MWSGRRGQEVPAVRKRISRQDCLSCCAGTVISNQEKRLRGLPFHENAHWRQMRDHDSEAWADAVAVDLHLRTGLPRMRGEVFLHRSCVPLDRPICRPPPITASSICGRTNARGCAGCNGTSARHSIALH